MITLDLLEIKACKTCNEEKPLSDFPLRADKQATRPSCRKCLNRRAYALVADRTKPYEARSGNVKTCTACGMEKHEEAFPLSADKSGRRPTCRKCLNLEGYNSFSKHGVTPMAYAEMLFLQGGVCAICKKENSQQRGGRTLKLHVDHDHVTGMVRGLLCHNCNTAIGLLKDNTALLQAAISYLNEGGQ